MYVFDFECIFGQLLDFILGYVCVGKDEVIVEIEEFGFDFVEEIELLGLIENYFLWF